MSIAPTSASSDTVGDFAVQDGFTYPDHYWDPTKIGQTVPAIRYNHVTTPMPQRTFTITFDGTDHVDENSYIQVAFDGQLFPSTANPAAAPLSHWGQDAAAAAIDPDANVYNFYFDGEYCIDNCPGRNQGWSMEVTVDFVGSDWSRPKQQWVTLVNTAEENGSKITDV